MSSTYKQLGRQIGALVDQKNAAYGDSFGRSDAFLKLLFPHGIPTAQMHHALVLGRIFDKLSRIATDPDALGESPYIDIAGYAMLGAHMHEESKKRCGSVRPDAEEQLMEQSGSAAPSAPKPTTTNAEPQIAQPSPQPSTEPSRATSNASAALVAEANNPTSVVDLARARNFDRRCAFCEIDVLTLAWHPVRAVSAYDVFHVCSDACLNALILSLRKEAR